MLIVGGGNMGGALALSCFGNQKDFELVLIDSNKERCEELRALGLDARIDTKDYNLEEVDTIVIAVKPQSSDSVVEELSKNIKKEVLWISIMAGKSIESLMSSEKVKKVVRLMPNLPTIVGKGTIGAYANPEVSSTEKKWLDNCLSKANEVIWVEDENKIDAITSISGSGPAYVFYFMNSIYQKAKDFGFSDVQSKKLVNNTFAGALSILNQSDLGYEDWIAKVKSKKGTTEAALDCFAELEVEKSIQNAIEKAYQRAKELSS